MAVTVTLAAPWFADNDYGADPTTSASFSVAVGDLLVVPFYTEGGEDTTTHDFGLPINSGTAFTWTKTLHENTASGTVGFYTAIATAAQTMTVTIGNNAEWNAVKNGSIVWKVTGYDPVDPFGLMDTDSGNMNDRTQGYTAESANSVTLAFCGDYQEVGPLTSPDLQGYTFNQWPSFAGLAAGWKVNTAAGTGSFTLETTAGGLAWYNIGWLEIKAAAVWATDDFNRANAATWGPAWTEHASGGSQSIVSNAGRLTTRSTSLRAELATTTNQVTEVTFNTTVPSSDGEARAGIICATDGDTGYWLRVYGWVEGAIWLYRNGVEVANVGSGAWTHGAVRFRLEKSGSTIKGYVNGVERISYTDGSPLTGKRFGLGLDFAGNTAEFDNFVGGDLAAEPPLWFTDDFNRADGPLGPNWELINPNGWPVFTIVSNKAHGDNEITAITTARCATTDQVAYADWDPTLGECTGPHICSDPSATWRGGYCLVMGPWQNNFWVYKNNVFMADIPAGLSTLTGVHRIGIKKVGNVISASVDGVTLGTTWTDTGTLLTGKRVGIGASTNAPIYYDNFAGGDVSAEPVPPVYKAVKTQAGGTSITINETGMGLVEGDVVFAFVAEEDSASDAIVPPADFTLVRKDREPTGGRVLAGIFEARRGASAIGSAWTLPTGGAHRVTLIAYSGAKTSGSAVNAHSGVLGTASQSATPVTTTVPGCLLLGFVSRYSWGPTTSATYDIERLDTTENQAIYEDAGLTKIPGTSPTLSITDWADGWHQLIALAPAAGVAPPVVPTGDTHAITASGTGTSTGSAAIALRSNLLISASGTGTSTGTAAITLVQLPIAPATFYAAGTLAALASGTSITATLPANTVAIRDVAVVAFWTNATSTFSTPAGWTLLGTTISNTNIAASFFYKRLTGGDANPVTTCTTLSTTIGGYGRVYVWRDVGGGTTPFEDVALTGGTSASTTPATTATTTDGPSRVLTAIAAVDDDNTWSSGMPPAGWSNIGGLLSSQTGGDAMVDAIQRIVPAATTIAAVNVGTMNASDYWRVVTFAVAPARLTLTASGTGTSSGTAAITIVPGVPAEPGGTEPFYENFTLPANGTTSHTVNFTPARAGAFLMVIAGGAVTHTATGWTKGASGLNSNECCVLYKTATAGESSVVINHNGADWPIAASVIQFPGGGSYSGGVSYGTAAWGEANPTLSGLTPDENLWVFAAYTQVGTTLSANWSAPNVEGYDVTVPDPGHSGDEGDFGFSWCYQEGYGSTTYAPQPNISTAHGYLTERITFAALCVPVPTEFTPAALPGVIGWWDGADAASFTYSSGAVVSQWADKSGTHHLTVPGDGGSVGPTRVTADLTAPIVRFNGTSTALHHVGSNLVTGTTLTIAFVARINNRVHSTRFASFTAISDNDWQLPTGCVVDQEGGASGFWPSLVRAYPNPAALADSHNEDIWVIGVGVWDGVNMSIYVNNVLNDSVASTGTFDVDRMFFGRAYSPQDYFDGDTAEIVVSSAALDATQRTDLYGYLQEKWLGAPEPITHAITASGSASSSGTATLFVAHALRTPAVVGLSTTTGTMAVARAFEAVAVPGTSTTTGSMTRSVPLSATAAGLSSNSGVARVAVGLVGTAAGLSNTAGTLEGVSAHLLVGTTAGLSTTTAAMAVQRPLSGSVAGLSATTAAMATADALQGSAEGLSTTTGALARSVPVAGATAASSTTTGAMAVARALVAIPPAGLSADIGSLARAVPLSGTTAGLSSTTAAARNAVTLAGSALGASQTQGLLAGTAATPLVGTATGVSTTTGAMVGARGLVGTTAGLSSTTGELRATRPLSAVAPAGASTTTGAMAVARSLVGTTPGTSTTTAALSAAAGVGATSTGGSTTTGALAGMAKALNASANGTSTTTGNLTSQAPNSIAGATFGGSTTTGNLGVAMRLGTASAAGSSGGTGTISRVVPITTLTVVGTSTATATIAVTRGLDGASSGLSVALATARVAVALIGTADGQSTVLAVMPVHHPLSGASVGIAASTGNLRSSAIYGLWNGQVFEAMQYGDKEVVDWMMISS